MQNRVDVAIECGQGWNSLIVPLIDYVEDHNSKVTNEEDKITITQIKEKFGGLEFYTHNTTKELEKMIREARNKSYKKCEICGSEENVGQTTDGWITTCCEKCIREFVNSDKISRKWRKVGSKKDKIIKYEK